MRASPNIQQRESPIDVYATEQQPQTDAPHKKILDSRRSQEDDDESFAQFDQ